jgi:predicted type IV restriction endonuclease
VSDLQETVEQLRRKINRYGKSGVNEQNTKSTLIQPLLRALGWDVEDLDDVHLEYKQKSKDKPVDYALLLLRSPCMFLEAKALGESLDDRRWANQVMGYASVAGVEWVVLSDGDEYRVYNSHATVPVEEKLFRKVRITDESTCPEKTLALLSKEQMQERQINRLWDAHFVDRQVQAALQQLIVTEHEPDMALVRLLAKRIVNLTPSEIRAGLRRLEVEITCPLTDTLEPPTRVLLTSSRPARRKVKPKANPKEKREANKSTDSRSRVSVADLVQAGLLTTPAKLFKKYKGRHFEATLFADGSVEFQGQKHASCSTAASIARGTVIGRIPATNGWQFWKFTASSGKSVLLDEVRQEFLQKRGK